MMRKGRKIVPTVLAAALVAVGWANPALARSKKKKPARHGKLIVHGSERIRVESMSGQFRPFGPEQGTVTLVQSRVLAKYRSGPFTIGGEIMDARAYGEKPNTTLKTGSVNVFEPVQYFLKYRMGNLLGTGSRSTLEIGQMRMHLGSRRLVNSPRFRNTTDTYLGVRLDRHGADGSRLTLFWTLPTQRLPDSRQAILDNAFALDRNSFSRQFAGIFYRRPAGKTRLELFGYYLSETDSPGHPTRNRHLFTPGFRFYTTKPKGRVYGQFEGMLQFGTAHRTAAPSDTTSHAVWAQAFHAELGYTFDAPSTPRIALVADYGSGQGGGDRITRFDQLFGAIFPDFAPPGLYGPMKWANVLAPGINFFIHPGKLRIWAKYRLMLVPRRNDFFGRTHIRSGPGRLAGNQFFIRVRYPLTRHIRFQAGAALLIKGPFLSHAPTTLYPQDSRYYFGSIQYHF